MRRFVLLIAALACIASPCGFIGEVNAKDDQREKFVINDARPYVYLEIDHVGPRIARSESEPNDGIWARLHNNCTVPIVIRTFGVPPDSPKGEIGLLDNVVANSNPSIGDGVITYDMRRMSDPRLASVLGTYDGLQQPLEVSGTQAPAIIPSGYMFPVSSFAVLEPGQSIYFSLPLNHVSDSWHIEIPFRFELKARSSLRAPVISISLYKLDLASFETH